MFNPLCRGSNNSMSLPYKLANVLESLSMEERKVLQSNIWLLEETTLVKGFSDRLQKEL